MQAVYSDWALSLGEFSLGAINHAIELSKEMQHPPNLGEFKAHCRTYKPPYTGLDYKLTPEQLEKNKRRIAEIKKNLAEKMAAQNENN